MTKLEALAELKQMALRVRAGIKREVRDGLPPTSQTIAGLRQIADEARRAVNMPVSDSRELDTALLELATMTEKYADDLEVKRQRMVN